MGALIDKIEHRAPAERPSIDGYKVEFPYDGGTFYAGHGRFSIRVDLTVSNEFLCKEYERQPALAKLY
mgnify:FL=1